MRWQKCSLPFFIFFVNALPAQHFPPASPDSLPPPSLRWKKTAVYAGGGAVTAGTLAGLASLWYDPQNRSTFHTFNDNRAWQQMDKIGHAFSAYQGGLMGMNALGWAGAKNGTRRWLGGGAGLAFLSAVEIMDGYSAGWGFSWGDMLANASGAGLAIGQDALWGLQKIRLKSSYHASPYSVYRPELLGANGRERWLKDYNGQTYWLSAGLQGLGAQKLPKWLSVSLGYGAAGMLGGHSNPSENAAGIPLPQFERYRRFFISPDIDLAAIPFRSKTMKNVCRLLNWIKMPLPALEFNRIDKIRFHWLYF